jgi:dTDP-L-rhamnose 4-epimerase
MDADGSLDPQQLPLVAAAVLAGEADLVLGRRRPTARGAWPLHGRAGNALFAWELRRRSGLPVHDLGPMRAARRQPLLELGLTDRRSGYALEMVAAAGKAGWRVREVDVTYAPRTGRSKVTGSVRGTLTALHDMQEVLRRVATR